jgi:mevalonate pyrophosphate decarboxylase
MSLLASPEIGFSRFSESSSTHRPQEQSAQISVSMGLSQKRCSKCSKLAEKLRQIEALLNSGQVEQAHELVREMVDELKRA